MKQSELRQIIREEISKAINEVNIANDAASFSQSQKVGCWAINGKTSDFIHEKLRLPKGHLSDQQIESNKKAVEKKLEKDPKYCKAWI